MCQSAAPYDERFLRLLTDQVRHIDETFGQLSGTVPTVHILNCLQAQHLDTDFYDHHLDQGACLKTHRSHVATWHRVLGASGPGRVSCSIRRARDDRAHPRRRSAAGRPRAPVASGRLISRGRQARPARCSSCRGGQVVGLRPDLGDTGSSLLLGHLPCLRVVGVLELVQYGVGEPEVVRLRVAGDVRVEVEPVVQGARSAGTAAERVSTAAADVVGAIGLPS